MRKREERRQAWKRDSLYSLEWGPCAEVLSLINRPRHRYYCSYRKRRLAIYAPSNACSYYSRDEHECQLTQLRLQRSRTISRLLLARDRSWERKRVRAHYRMPLTFSNQFRWTRTKRVVVDHANDGQVVESCWLLLGYVVLRFETTSVIDNFCSSAIIQHCSPSVCLHAWLISAGAVKVLPPCSGGGPKSNCSFLLSVGSDAWKVSIVGSLHRMTLACFLCIMHLLRLMFSDCRDSCIRW